MLPGCPETGKGKSHPIAPPHSRLLYREVFLQKTPLAYVFKQWHHCSRIARACYWPKEGSPLHVLQSASLHERRCVLLKKEMGAPILALFFVSLGGLLLHIRIHPPSEEASHWVPVIFGVISTFVLPFLFSNARTVAWAYLINMAAVVVGTIMMAAVSIEEWEGAVTLDTVLLRSTFPDIMVLFAKLPLGHYILRHLRPKSIEAGIH
jgi:hypothetical protein